MTRAFVQAIEHFVKDHQIPLITFEKGQRKDEFAAELRAKDYKGTRIKQYHKEGRALRTETTINNTKDFYIGKSLRNLPARG